MYFQWTWVLILAPEKHTDIVAIKYVFVYYSNEPNNFFTSGCGSQWIFFEQNEDNK